MKLLDRLKSARRSNPSDAVPSRFAGFWATRNARERRLLRAAVAVASAGLFYTVLIGPALSGREQLNKNLPLLRQQAAQLQALAQEAAALSSKMPAPGMPATMLGKENIEAALANRGLKAQNVMMNGDMARVQLAGASFSGMLNWLDDLQKNARVAVVEANVVVQPQPDAINAMLTLKLQ